MTTAPIERMQVGVILPTFRDDLNVAREALSEAEAAGLDGAFVYDHMWPMRHREQPAIACFPALGALCPQISSLTLGTLVARVAVVDIEVLFRQLVTVYECSEHRFIAGIGTGDSKGAEEFSAYGLEFPSAMVRRNELRELGNELNRVSVPVWVGGGSPATNALAHELGATLNLWGASPEVVREHAEYGPVSWAGNLPADPDQAHVLVRELANAGATWAVFAWPGSAGTVRDAAAGVAQ